MEKFKMRSFIAQLKRTWYVPVTLLVIGALSFLIYYIPLANESLRLDESQSIWQASHSLKETLFIVAQDVHVPLYHVIFHFWITIFGTSTAMIRLLSFILFLLTMPFIYLLGRTILSRKWSLVVVGLIALSPFISWYANEARMYTLLGLMSVLCQYLFIRIMRGQKSSWPWYVLVCMIGVYSHYFFIFNLATQALFFFFNLKRFPKGSFLKFVGTAIATAASLSPWIVYFISMGAASNTKPNIAPPTPIDFFNVYSQFLFGFQSTALNTILIAFWPLMVVLALMMVRKFYKPDLAVYYIATAAFVPVLLAYLLSFVVSPFFLSRYMIAAVIPLYILIAWILSRYSKKIAVTAVVIVFALTALLSSHQLYANDAPVRENYKILVDDIKKEATPNDVIVMSSPFTVYPFEYYYDGPLQIKTLPIWDRQNPGPVTAYDREQLPEQVETLRKGHQNIYLVLSYDQGYEEEIRDYFNERFALVESKTYSPGLDLFVYRVNYQPEVQ
ncbi:MAG: glycosyltransferase family 39 protein [Candidatus Microsaccharimonas sp.]